MNERKSIEFPADVVRELMEIRYQSERGVALLAETEARSVKLEMEADRIEYVAFLDAQGTVADRTAYSKLKALNARQESEIAKIEVARIKVKLRQLSEALNATQTAGKMIELQWKTAGIER